MYKGCQILINTKYNNKICICSGFTMGFVCNSRNGGWLNFFLAFPWHTMQSGRCIIPVTFSIGEAFPELRGYISSILCAYGNLLIDSMEGTCSSAPPCSRLDVPWRKAQGLSGGSWREDDWVSPRTHLADEGRHLAAPVRRGRACKSKDSERFDLSTSDPVPK